MVAMPTMLPAASRIGETVLAMSSNSPVFVRRIAVTLTTEAPAAVSLIITVMASRSESGTSSMMLRPVISSAR